jgi:hypothetical protein
MLGQYTTHLLIVHGYPSLFLYTYIGFSSPDTLMTCELSDTKKLGDLYDVSFHCLPYRTVQITLREIVSVGRT